MARYQRANPGIVIAIAVVAIVNSSLAILALFLGVGNTHENDSNDK
jgi:formate hydrogenlyase subunit 3/multisubunit Na+/H+ antiporter MnhD subunit